MANLLWLAESEYPKYDGSEPGITIAAWVQYILDNFETVDEVVEQMAKEEFVIVTAEIPGSGRIATLHLAVSDPTGDNAIFEYIDGELKIHHNPSYVVMTNSPTYEKQLSVNEYWEEVGGLNMLPGTNRAADRFARHHFM